VGSLAPQPRELFLGRPARGDVPAPTAPVALENHQLRAFELLPVLEGMSTSWAGLGRLVKGKTVAFSSTSMAAQRCVLDTIRWASHWANPNLVCAVMSP